jgi:hypothetical protein
MIPESAEVTDRMKKIVMLCVPPAQGSDVLGPLEAFGIASRTLEEEVSGHRGYESELVTNSSDLLIPTVTGVGIIAGSRHAHHRRWCGRSRAERPGALGVAA